MHERARDEHDLEPLRPETVTAILSSTERRGEWLPAEEVRVRACLGNVTLDFRRALLAPGITTLECLAFMGAIEVIVPPGLEVELAASAVMGAVEQKNSGAGHVRRFIASQIRKAIDPDSHRREREREDDGEDAPLLRIEGHAVFGAITVKVR